jgi:ribosomal protein L20
MAETNASSCHGYPTAKPKKRTARKQWLLKIRTAQSLRAVALRQIIKNLLKQVERHAIAELRLAPTRSELARRASSRHGARGCA